MRKLLDASNGGEQCIIVTKGCCSMHPYGRIISVGGLSMQLVLAVTGVHVSVRRGQLTLRLVTPVPGMPRKFPLHPEDGEDPSLFRVDLSALGMGTSRVVFSRVPETGTAALHVELPGMPMSFRKQPAARDPRRWAIGALGALGIAAAARPRHGPAREVRP